MDGNLGMFQYVTKSFIIGKRIETMELHFQNEHLIGHQITSEDIG